MISKHYPILVILFIILFVSIIASLCIGRVDISFKEAIISVISFFTKESEVVSEKYYHVVSVIRMPRVIIAVLVGAALAASGAAYQGLFKNPIVSPDILGVSSGAAVGASLGIIFSFRVVDIQIIAFVFGLLSVFLVVSISTMIGKGRPNILIMILCGIVISSIFSSFTSLLQFTADSEKKLPEITFWLMGSLARSGTFENIAILSTTMFLGFVPLFLLRWRINVLSFGEEEARALGVNTKVVSLLIISSSTLLTASCVALCGIIGWVGLVIPHMGRLLVGPDFRILLPVSMLVGSIFILWVDNLARALTPSEIPLGILTSIFGAPIFIYLLFSGKKSWI